MKNTVLTADRIVSHPDHVDHVFSKAVQDRIFALQERLVGHGYSIDKIEVNKRSVRTRVVSANLRATSTYSTLEDFLAYETARLNQMDKNKAA